MSKILIIGAGVSGLTSAYCLAEAGHEVTVISKDFSPNITSNVAGALWEWPPAVCGYHSDLISLERSKEWCMTSYNKFYELAQNEQTGVYIREVYFFFKEFVKNNSFNFNKMNELKSKVKGFFHDASLLEREGINPNTGMVDAYVHEAPMVDTDIYMTWLMKEVEKLGVQIIQREIKNKLVEIEELLLNEYQCDFIINCSGLGAIVLADEYMYPLRGALVRLINNGKKSPVIDKAYCVSFDEKTREQDIVFIVPRGKNHVILGALAEEGEWSTNINLENYEPIQKMFERCKNFLPQLSDMEIDISEPVRVGLRPFRIGNVRLNWENNSSIIHNYGHGGAGVTFSWGCAEEIVSMISERIATQHNSVSLISENQ